MLTYPCEFEHRLTLELQTESNLKHSRVVLLFGNDAEVWSVQAVARVLEAHIIENIKCIGPELKTLMFRPRQNEILESVTAEVAWARASSPRRDNKIATTNMQARIPLDISWIYSDICSYHFLGVGKMIGPREW